MNQIRRIVTGHSKDGKSIIASDTYLNAISISPGKNFIQLWADDEIPLHPNNGKMEDNLEWFPKPGGHRFFVWVVPPKSEISSQSVTKEELNALLPGFAEKFEPNNPGMHTTDSVDCSYVISGAIILELDDEVEIELKEKDSVIQNGTRHRWHNRGTIPAVLITTSIGSKRR